MMKLNSRSLALCLLFVGNSGFAKNPTSTVSNTKARSALMEMVEQTATLPEGAATLDQYDRFYTYMGDRSIIGIYVRTDLRSGSHTGERHWVSKKEMPQISGGGCSVVTVFYNPKTRKTDSMCNFAQ